MFDSEFYPTPMELGKEIAKEILFRFADNDKIHCRNGLKILDPSAGKGDLLMAFKELDDDFDFKMELFKKDENAGYRYMPDLSFDLYGIEPLFDLQTILTSKGIKVVDNDFLKFKTFRKFDAIVMNPPFSNGSTHLLKAWEISLGGPIVCILNAETIRNPYTEERQLLAKIIADNNGTIEFRQHEFKNAEHSTDVEIAIVKLEKPVKKMSGFEFQGSSIHINADFSKDDLMNQLARKDIIENWIVALDKSIESLRGVFKSYVEWNHYFDIVKDDSSIREELAGLKNFCGIQPSEELFADAVENLHRLSWDNLFIKTNIRSLMTEGVRKKFESQADQLGALAFTRENIERILEGLFESKDLIMQECVVESFDYLTLHHKDNRVHVEGWKTNDAYKVNKRVVIPDIIDIWQAKYNHHSVYYHSQGKLSDLEKALSFLERQPCTSSLILNLKDCLNRKLFNEWHDSKYFLFKFYKKGTLHLEFKDRQLLEEFNIQAAKGKMWLPEETRSARHRFSDDVA